MEAEDRHPWDQVASSPRHWWVVYRPLELRRMQAAWAIQALEAM